MTKQQKRRRLVEWLTQLLGLEGSASKPVRAIRAEPLEKRELMATDAYAALFGPSQSASDSELLSSMMYSASSYSSDFSRLQGEGEGRLVGEGEPADDLVAFAKALAATNTRFFGADWCAFCNQQKALFQDGGKYLPYVEVTNADRTPNSVATQNNITTYPTWVFPDGSRLEGVQTLATIAQRSGVAIPRSESVYLSELSNRTVATGSPLYVPLDGYSPTGRPITYSVTSSNPNLIAASISSPSNRSLRITTEGYGDMVFELFEDKAPRPSGRVIDLANQGFYDGLTFHRVVAGFVIQGGDPQGTGSGGSPLGNFDDQFHLDLQHNQSGVLSFAKSTDDTNNSQFFVTAGPTRFLDFNHSVFGQLVEGDSVRRGIDRVPVNASSRPNFPVNMSDVSVFQDNENGLVFLRPTGNGTGTSTITVTATDDQGRQTTRTFTATVVADTSNGAPFLNDIPVLQATAGQTLTYTLTSQDKENNPVTYSVTKLGTTDYTLNVNPQSGVVTLTPPTGFTGTLQFRASVQQTTSTTTNDPTDSQLVTVNVASSTSLTLALAAASDTGTSNSDGITNATTLTLNVGGTTPSGTVEVLNGTTVIGTATATGSSTVVTVNAASLSGNVQLTARQTLNGQSVSSPALALTLDRTAPVQVSPNTIPASATVASPLSVDLAHPEEGSGLVYALTNAPTGMTINGSTGVISWTPTQAQLGSQSFTLTLTDRAGNQTQQSLSINVIRDPLLRKRLNIVSLTGTPLTNLQTGQQFKVQLLLADLRQGAAAQGAFSAYADLFFDPAVVRPIANSPITHISPYTGSRSGSVGEGVIDEVGGIAGIEPLGPDERLFAEVTFEAIAAGNANFRLDPADSQFNETTLFGGTGALDTDLIQFGTASVAVGANFTLVNDTFNFDEDSPQQTLNVLSNDVAGTGVTLTIVEVSSASLNGTVTIASGGQSLLYRPAANANGAETFTYTVANAGGVRQTATVTIQLTDVNDPPVATNDNFTVNESSSLNVLDVLANDTKGVDNSSSETLTVTQVSSGSAGGTITVGTSGLNIRYTPRVGFTGTETFTYTLSDGRGGTAIGSVSVLVAPLVPPPTVQNESFTVVEDAAEASFDVLANDSPRTAGNALTLNEVRPSTNGSVATIGSDGRLRYRPAANFSGTELITYTVRETGGGIGTGTVTFTVTPVNDAPVAVADNLTVLSSGGNQNLNVLANDTDVDTGDVLTITQITQPPTGSGTLAISADARTVIYTPPSATFEGNFTFNYTIRDTAGLTATATASVRVNSFTPRNIEGNVFLAFAGSDRIQLQSVPITLSGTTLTGTNVNLTSQTSRSGSFVFNNLAPGNYTLQRQPLPFLNDPGQSLAIQSNREDGNVSRNMEITGSLLSQYIDARDFLGSSFRKTVTTVLGQNGSTQWVAPQGDWSNLTSLGFQVNTSSLTINAANATASNLTASVPLNNPQLTRAVVGDHQLIRLRGATTRFNLAPPATNNSGGNNNSPASGEGEFGGNQSQSQLVSDPNRSSLISNVSSRLMGEGEAAPSIETQAATSNPTGGRALLASDTTFNVGTGLNSSEQHAGLQQNLVHGSSPANSGEATAASDTAGAVDQAMSDLLPSLRRRISSSLLEDLAVDRIQHGE